MFVLALQLQVCIFSRCLSCSISWGVSSVL